MTLIASMQLIEAGPNRVLAGHSADTENVYVLRRDGDVYQLHKLTITDAEQELRSFLAADQAERGELVNAILQAFDKPPAKRRKRKAK